ncbi:MAG: prepilin-type N-terminal cleavage/methylation domain-containing protein [Candidatus Aminicenantes bacterium]|nr:prepilin-type N-terminal cleavage/methylation domain-containing protein [Candidatus Aminicenantes bacterium]
MLKRKKGFTLIELLIVVAIVGILAALLIPNAISAMQKAKQKGTMKDVATISTALTDYVTDNGRAPEHAGIIDVALQQTLAQLYLKICPLEDQWGNPLEVHAGQDVGTDVRGCIFGGNDDFVVYSQGRDGVGDGVDYNPMDPEAGMYLVSTMADFENDLIMFNGAWVRAPITRTGSTAE